MPEIKSLGGSFIEMDGFLDNVILPLHRSPLLPLQLRRGKYRSVDGPEHHDCARASSVATDTSSALGYIAIGKARMLGSFEGGKPW